MKPAYILETLYKTREGLTPEQLRSFDFHRTHPDEIKCTLYHNPHELGALLAELMTEAEREITTDEAKRAGRLDVLKAAQRVIKHAKEANSSRPVLHGAWIDSAGRQCICDAFQAYRLREPLDLEKIPEKLEPVDLSRIVTPNEGEALKLPTVGELRAYIKTEKARLKAEKKRPLPVWDFGEGLPMLDASFLLNALELLPDCTATASKHRQTTWPVYFKSEAGDGCICPVRKGV